MKKNDLVEVNCTFMGSDCKGVCKADEHVFYIPFLLPNEKARIRVSNVSRDAVYGDIDCLFESSSFRVEPRCGSYMKCGSCSLMHYDYEKQLEFKSDMVHLDYKKENLRVNVCKTIGMKNPYNYRNKVVASFGMAGKEIIYGLYEEGTHNIIASKNCLIQDNTLNKVLLSIKELMVKNKIMPEGYRGVLRHVLLRIGVKTNEVMVVFVTNSDMFPGRNELVKQLVSKHKEIKTIVQNTNPRVTPIVLGDKERVLYGPGFINDELLGIKFKISPKSFYQVNPYQTEKLYSKAIELADLKKTDVVLDAYCGIGTISLALASKCKNVIGVEIVKEAINDAINNARNNKINNARFFCDDAKKFMATFKEKIDCLVVDPPRSGCEVEFLNAIVRLKPMKIVYVSCNPITQAANIKYLLSKADYEIKVVQPVDMFPHTNHVESVCLLQIKNSF